MEFAGLPPVKGEPFKPLNWDWYSTKRIEDGERLSALIRRHALDWLPQPGDEVWVYSHGPYDAVGYRVALIANGMVVQTFDVGPTQEWP